LKIFLTGAANTGFFVYLQFMAKSQMNKILVTAGAALGVLALFRAFMRKGEAIKSLNVNVTKVDFNQRDKTFVVFVRMINPANASVNVKSIVGDVLWNGTFAATMDFRNETRIGPNEEKTIQIPVKLNLELLTLVTDLLTKKIKDIVNGRFEVKAVVNAEGFVVPFTYSKDIKIGA